MLNKTNVKRGEVKMVSVPLQALIQSYYNNIIENYDNNRGAVGIKAKKVEMISEQFSFVGVGALMLAEKEDGTFRFADGHTRMQAIVRRQTAGKFSAEDLSRPIALHIINEQDHMEGYIDTNNGDAHTSAAKLSNPDYLLGNWGYRFLKQAELKLTPGFQQNMWDVIMASMWNDGKAALKDVYTTRSRISTELLNLQAGAKRLLFGEEFRNRIIGGLVFYKNFINEVAEQSPKNNKTGKILKEYQQIQKSPGLFTALFHDYMSSAPVIANRSIKNLATAAVNNKSSLISAAQTVARRNKNKVDAATLFRALGINSGVELRNKWSLGVR